MAHPLKHAESSARTWGGDPSEYLKYHEWMDESKALVADPRHRALRHHAEGIFMLQTIFGPWFVNSVGKKVYVRYLGEQHVLEDLGRIPSFQDWIQSIRIEPWMKGQRLTCTEEV
jgi:Domain of unknown function (DUF6915)